MFVERGTAARQMSRGKTAWTVQVGNGAWRLMQSAANRHAKLLLIVAVSLPVSAIGLGAGSLLNSAHGQSESNAVVSSVQEQSSRVRSEPMVTGAAMHVALFVPRN